MLFYLTRLVDDDLIPPILQVKLIYEDLVVYLAVQGEASLPISRGFSSRYRGALQYIPIMAVPYLICWWWVVSLRHLLCQQGFRDFLKTCLLHV